MLHCTFSDRNTTDKALISSGLAYLELFGNRNVLSGSKKKKVCLMSGSVPNYGMKKKENISDMNFLFLNKLKQER